MTETAQPLAATPPQPNTNTVPSLADIGYGSAFSISSSTTSPISYTQVAEVTDIDWAGITIGKEDVTHLGSPNAYREYKPTLVDPGTISLEGNWLDDATQSNMYTMASTRQIFPFMVQNLVQGNSKTYTVTGFGFFEKITPLGKITADKAIKFSAQIQITGVITPVLQ
jgi:hypothetical protein